MSDTGISVRKNKCNLIVLCTWRLGVGVRVLGGKINSFFFAIQLIKRLKCIDCDIHMFSSHYLHNTCLNLFSCLLSCWIGSTICALCVFLHFVYSLPALYTCAPYKVLCEIHLFHAHVSPILLLTLNMWSPVSIGSRLRT